MTRCSESSHEAAVLTPLVRPRTPRTGKIRKRQLLSHRTTTLIGTWNVRTLRETGRCAQAVKELRHYKLTILGICETRWNTFGETKLQTGETLLYSGKENENDPHQAGVALLLSKEAMHSLMEWEPVSDRTIRARLDSRFQEVTIIMCYAPTNAAGDGEKEQFYNQLQSVLDKIPKRDMLILMGDMNAKVGQDNNRRENEMGTHGIGDMNEIGELLADLCTVNELVIGGTLFPHRNCHKATWVSPDHHTENQIDHVAVRQRWRGSLQDVRAKRGADIGSDHHLVVAKLKMRLAARKKKPCGRIRFNVGQLKFKEKREEFQLALHNRFQELLTEKEEIVEETTEQAWACMKETLVGTSEEVLGRLPSNRKQWISDDTWQKVETRKKLRQQVNQAKTRLQKQHASTVYNEMAKEVKKSLRSDKRQYFNEIAEQAESAALKGDLKTLYSTTKQLSGRRNNPNRPVRDKKGKLLTSVEDQIARWREHFQEVLNRPPPENPLDLEPGDALDINTGEITKQEIHKAINSLKVGKTAGADCIPPEVLKGGGPVLTDQLHKLLNLIWRNIKIPKDWGEMASG